MLRESNFSILQGKRVGLITNPSGVDAQLVSTIDILFRAPGVKLVALFGPEHGVRGDYARATRFDTYTDAQTALPVYSSTARPASRRRRCCRASTCSSTTSRTSVPFVHLHQHQGLAMEAAADANIEFVVLDRPNPLGGLRVEGNTVEPPFTSFVSQFPIPYVYGLTLR